MTRTVLVIAAGIYVSAAILISQDAAPVTTKHTSRVDSAVLTYTVQVGRVPIRAMDAEAPRGHMFYVAYRMPAKPGAPRPLTFLWGGGPSSSGLGTHFTFGPRTTLRYFSTA